MPAKVNSTRKVRQPIRFDTVDLNNGKTFVPIRTEDGEMEYELHYNDRFIGFAYEESAARDRLNEYAYDMERGNCEVNDAVALASASVPTADLDAPLPFEPEAPRSKRVYGPQISYSNDPHAPISTLRDGSTVYGHYDTDDSHFAVSVDTADGWYITADERSVGIYHKGHHINIDALSPDAWASLKALVNSEAVEHLFTCGKAWDTNQDVPAHQPLNDAQRLNLFGHIDACLAPATPTPPAALTIEQKAWPDIDEETYTSTVYRYGQAEVIVHHDGVPGNLTAYDLVVNDHNLNARDVQGIRDAAILLADTRVQAALEVIGLPVPPVAPQAPAPVVTVEPLVHRDNVDGSVHYATAFALGGASIWLDDDGGYDVTVNGIYHAPCDVPAMRDAAALVESAAFRTARMRLEAGITALPQCQMRRVA